MSNNKTKTTTIVVKWGDGAYEKEFDDYFKAELFYLDMIEAGDMSANIL